MNAALYDSFKGALDRVAAALTLPMLVPILGVLGALIKVTSRGPVFYLSDRLGRGGSVFKMRKLRSMINGAPQIVDADLKTVLSDDDPRLTPIGRFLRIGFDELPQFLNVLGGDMSIVGPRPDAAWMTPRYTPLLRERLAVKPGITGLAQVLDARSMTTAMGYLLDVYYARHRRPTLDAMILLWTVPYILGFKRIGSRRLSRILQDPTYTPRLFEPLQSSST